MFGCEWAHQKLQTVVAIVGFLGVPESASYAIFLVQLSSGGNTKLNSTEEQ